MRVTADSVVETIASFDIAFASRTVTGTGCSHRASDQLRRVGAQRVGVVANRSLREGSQAFQHWLETLGSDVPVFCNVQAHTPRKSVLEAIRFFRERRCDSLVSFGSGSAIDTAKGVALGIAAGIESAGDFEKYVNRVTPDGGITELTLDHQILPHIAIPTTLSGAAHSHSVGISDPHRGEKHLHIHPGLGPQCVFLDPLVTLDTPRSLWAGTGMKALEHAVEGLYSRVLPPFAEPMRMHAFQVLTRDLVLSLETDSAECLVRRTRVLAAGGLAVLGWPSVAVGLSHALGHQAGAAWHIEHGASTAIFLPRALEFNAPAAGHALEQMARSLGRSKTNSLECVLEKLREMTSALGLPHRLRDAGVATPEGFERVAEAAFHDPIMAGNPRAVTRHDLEEILRRAY